MFELDETTLLPRTAYIEAYRVRPNRHKSLNVLEFTKATKQKHAHALDHL